ncbi:MAG: hypothetical protein QXZ51_00650 [Candidatus Bathyarchaeia archaeon]
MAFGISFIANIIIILMLVLFLLIFAFMTLSFLKWMKASYYERPPAIKIEEYACPKCGSKELELIGRRTL